MGLKSDIEIANEAKPIDVYKLAKKLDLTDEQIDKYLEPYGKIKAKLDYRICDDFRGEKDAKLILVTAINPTPAGEGKTTVCIGLADSLNKIGKKTMAALREPSLGPVFGIKGGATGGGYAQVLPMADINLHFTGDFHAISTANNLLSAMIDNSIYQGNPLNIDSRRVTWNRTMDMNDRQLRFVIGGLNSVTNGVPRQDSFDITAACEIMAVLCLASDISDLKRRLSRMIVAYNYDKEPITAKDINAVGAMSAILKDAIKPNLVQTIENTPVLIHGGPFANIAHGCNSVIATKTARKLADYVVTEAGFGADLGAEKFLDIKCRIAEIKPDAVVMVATIKALKYHGGADKASLKDENIKALKLGLPNLLRHIDNVKNVYKLPCVVAINVFPTDTQAEIDAVVEECAKIGVKAIVTKVCEQGSQGGVELANEVVKLCDELNSFEYSYDLDLSIKDKIEAIATKIYRADGADFTSEALKDLQALEKIGDYISKIPVCIAKTQYSFSDNPNLKSAPENFRITVRKIRISAGAGFIVALTGDIMTMPGLPKKPAAEDIDIDESGVIKGIF